MHILGYILLVGQLSTSLVESCLRAETPEGCCTCTSFPLPETVRCPGSCRAGSYMAGDIGVGICLIFSDAPTRRRRTDDVSGTSAVSFSINNCTIDSTDGGKLVTCLPCSYGCSSCRGQNNCTSCKRGFKLSKTASDQGECELDFGFTEIFITVVAMLAAPAVLFGCGILLVYLVRCWKEHRSCYMSEACSRCPAVCSHVCTKRYGKCAPGTCTCMKKRVRVEQVGSQEQAAKDVAIELAPLPGALQTDVNLEGRRHSSADDSDDEIWVRQHLMPEMEER